MRAEPIHHGVHPPPPPLRRRVHATPPGCRHHHEPPKAPPACAPPEDAPSAAPISFWRYLEKHNREDRADLSRTSLHASFAARDANRPTPRGSEHDRIARAYAGNPMPRIGEVLDRRA